MTTVIFLVDQVHIAKPGDIDYLHIPFLGIFLKTGKMEKKQIPEFCKLLYDLQNGTLSQVTGIIN